MPQLNAELVNEIHRSVHHTSTEQLENLWKMQLLVTSLAGGEFT